MRPEPGFVCAALLGFGPASLPAAFLSPSAIRLEEMRQPDAREPGDGPISDRLETGAHRLLSVIDWSGIRFLHYETRTYWTADSGRSWKSHGWTVTDPKGTRLILADGRFHTTGSGLFLAGGNGVVAAARFDPMRDDFTWLDSGGPAAGSVTALAALGSDAGALYRYDLPGILSVSRDDGAAWQTVATVPYPAGGYPFEGLEAEGDRILLRFDPAEGISRDAGSLDGGKTWAWLPRDADAHLFAGCFHYAADDSLRSECAPEAADRKVRAPFRRLKRLFIQADGERYAFADSGVFHYQAGATAAEGSSDGSYWEPVGAPADWIGWMMAGEVFSQQTAEKVAWVPAGPPVSVSAAAPSRMRYLKPDRVRAPQWLARGRRPDGRAVRARTP